MHTAFLFGVMGLLGAIAGGFVAAVSVRLPRGEPWGAGRSRCLTCERPLSAWRQVPIFGWLFQGGRCGGCKAPISPRYILIESVGALVGVWAAASAPTAILVAATAILGWQLILIAVIDSEHFWLPDSLTLPLIATGLLFAFVNGVAPWDHVWGVLAGFGGLWTLALLYRLVRGREGLGGGDPILLAGAGAWTGWIGLPSVLLWACVVTGVVVIARAVAKRPVGLTDRLPFGSYLALGAWLTWIFGPLGL